MKLLGKISIYIALRFLKNFLMTISALTVLTFVISVSDEIRSLLELKVPLGLTFKYLLYKIPYMVLYTAPFASLVATLFTLAGLNKTNEIMAMRTSGISATKIITPILLLSFLLTLTTLALNETIITKLYAESTMIKVRDIWHSVPTGAETKSNLIYKSKTSWVIYIKHFYGDRNKMEGVTVIYPDEQNNIKKRIDAESADWDGTKWNFNNTIVREFSLSNANNLEPKEKAIKLKMYYPEIKESPAQLSARKKLIDQMTIHELNEEIKHLEAKGEKSVEERVFLHFKISYAFSIFMLSFLAIPFGINSGKYNGIVLSFAISFAVGFVYWQLISIGKVLGMHSVVAPYIAAWGGNAIFLVAGTLMLISIKK